MNTLDNILVAGQTPTPPQNPQGQTSHELDTLIVFNPDVDCDDIDSEEGYSHRDYFQVRWDKYPHKIAPGAQKRMPRFLAMHYAKHLADHMLIRMEEKTGRKGLMQSAVERPKMLAKIILGVDTHFLGESETGEGQKIGKAVDELNPEERPVDLGVVPDPALGVLKPEPKQVVKEPVLEVPILPTNEKKTSIWDDKKDKPTKNELLTECEKLGIEVKGNENIDTLIQKIKSF